MFLKTFGFPTVLYHQTQ